jgi:hypothetical protein
MSTKVYFQRVGSCVEKDVHEIRVLDGLKDRSENLYSLALRVD